MEEGIDKTRCEGSCHCGAVRYTARIPHAVEVRRCNCSMCAMCGFVHLIVSQADFSLQAGRQALVEYRFNTGTARHLFCRHCGIKSFYHPRSHPDDISLNFNCVQLPDKVVVVMNDFDGQNWEQHVQEISHLGQ